MRRSLPAACLALIAGCTLGNQDRAAIAEVQWDPSAPRPKRPSKPPWASAEGKDNALLAAPADGPAAYFEVGIGAIVRLDGQGFAQIWRGEFREFFEGGDGELYLRDDEAVYRLDDDAFVPVFLFDDEQRQEDWDASYDWVADPMHLGLFNRYRAMGMFNSWGHLSVGPEGELWFTAPMQRGVARVHRNEVTYWPSAEHTGVEGSAFRSALVDGRGRAWFMLVTDPYVLNLGDLGIVHKSATSWWGRVQGWELGRDYRVVGQGWHADERGGLWLLTVDALLHVSPSGVDARLEFTDFDPDQLVINGRRQALLHDDTGCELRRVDLDHLSARPVELTPTSGCSDFNDLSDFDDRGRAWGTARRLRPTGGDARATAVIVVGADRKARELLLESPADLLVVVGRGPELPVGVDARFSLPAASPSTLGEAAQ